jgi:hypothetical protein
MRHTEDAGENKKEINQFKILLNVQMSFAFHVLLKADNT